MFNPEMTTSTPSEENVSFGIYRHFKGGYYIVESIASREEDGEEVVVYTSLQNGRVWTRPLSQFIERVPKGKENPTGQAFRFVRVAEFYNQLRDISTKALYDELLNREDCPISIIKTAEPEKVWRQDYVVGCITKSADAFTNEVNERFEVLTVKDTIEEARMFAAYHTNVDILERIMLKRDV